MLSRSTRSAGVSISLSFTRGTSAGLQIKNRGASEWRAENGTGAASNRLAGHGLPGIDTEPFHRVRAGAVAQIDRELAAIPRLKHQVLETGLRQTIADRRQIITRRHLLQVDLLSV